ncbi:prephenate dehydrogenase/arogenate dehydrogenase family protein [Deferribacter autotrophicus]|uniref:Prephenate dehydrogenase/arogenate dehydrogenase family protein n=1 Tax=Deferribacter autotrophicus TaxID=500465 RepID=A0A5A8F2T3_9BACT|nr:prephenate dehydrogenase/arogenate dehydrogenase family protein [Deferribacter autotrophicus]KAA0257774.1 prephenate dehydrogenase/arogenate dehydrogenase family protein [Deferribacter autotrophicus]
MPKVFEKIGVIGIGLIGGSFAKAFYKKGYKIYGLDSNNETLLKAIESDIFEGVANTLDDFLTFDLDLIYITTPVSSAKKILRDLSAKNITIPITDACSTKFSLVKLAKELNLNFYGGHPIAGKEKSGFEYSDDNMLKGAYHFLTVEKDDDTVLALKKMHEEIGMVVKVMDAKKHDELFGLISHFPHLIAFALIDLVDIKNRDAFGFTGGGFKDFTRIAASEPRMWTDIFLDNSEVVVSLIDEFINILNSWKDNILDKKEDAIFHDIGLISNIRRGL